MKRDLKTVRDLLGAKTEELIKIKDAVEKENRARTEDETTQWNTLMAEKRSLEDELKFLVDADTLARAAATFPAGGGQTGNRDTSEGDQRDLAGFSLMRGLQLMTEGRSLDGLEAEVDAMGKTSARASNIQAQGFTVPAFLPGRETRAGQTSTLQTANPGDQGGLTVPTIVNQIILALWQRTFLDKVGARRLNGLTGNQEFPIQKTKPVAQLVGEIQTLADDGILFDQLPMAPKRRGSTIPVSKQLLLQSSIDVEALIIDNINKALGIQMNIDAINALLLAITTGNKNLVSLGNNGGVPTYANIIGLETAITSADADVENMAYLTNSVMRGLFKLTPQLANTAGVPVWNDSQINNYPAVSSNIVPSALTKGTATNASAIIFGNFSDLYVGMWGGTDFVVDPYTLAKTGQVQITANMYWDVEVARPASFAGIKDALPA